MLKPLTCPNLVQLWGLASWAVHQAAPELLSVAGRDLRCCSNLFQISCGGRRGGSGMSHASVEGRAPTLAVAVVVGRPSLSVFVCRRPSSSVVVGRPRRRARRSGAEECPANTETREGAADITDCVCKPGYYSPYLNTSSGGTMSGTSCVACHSIDMTQQPLRSLRARSGPGEFCLACFPGL